MIDLKEKESKTSCYHEREREIKELRERLKACLTREQQEEWEETVTFRLFDLWFARRLSVVRRSDFKECGERESLEDTVEKKRKKERDKQTNITVNERRN